jgi:hypothetical protein
MIAIIAGASILSLIFLTIPTSDLVPIQLSKEPLFSGVSNHLTVTIENRGDSDTARFNVSLEMNGAIIDKKRVSGLCAGDSTSIGFSWRPAHTGTYNLTVNADCDHEIRDSNEFNNKLSEIVEVLSTIPDLTIKEIDAYHYTNTHDICLTKPLSCSAWFNLSNFIEVTVKNKGLKAGPFNVSLYINGVFFDKKRVPGLDTGAQTCLTFNWTPIGCDCFDGCTPRTYELSAIADSDNEVEEEENEVNNNLLTSEEVFWNGYSADEPLINIAHGKLRGNLYITTGESSYYRNLSSNESVTYIYNIPLPEGSEVALARYNVPFTWCSITPTAEIDITTPGGMSYTVQPVTAYFDRPCEFSTSNPIYGNLVFNFTPYVQEGGVYRITLKNINSPKFYPSACPLVLVYKNDDKSLIEYWLNEGADYLIGGRRDRGGFLALTECINNASFPGIIDLNQVKKASLAVISPWGGETWEVGATEYNYLYFNGKKIGGNVYRGYYNGSHQSIPGITVDILSSNAQVGVNISDVTDYLTARDNFAAQGDNGDAMMLTNAFLVVEY